MNHIRGADRGEVLLLPEAIDDFITPENPVRFIDAFVAQLDLAAHGFTHALPKETGRPPYDPGDLLRLYLYGYLNRVRSSRRLETECQRNLEVLWLLRKLAPDFKTIADFRKDNSRAIKAAAREFTLLCKRLDLFGSELVAIDSTKIAAQNSKAANFSQKKLKVLLKEIDEKVASYLRELDRADAAEPAAGEQQPALSAEELSARIAELQERRAEYEELASRLNESGEKQISLTDPDARSMSQGQGAIIGYSVQAAVDEKHKLIVATEVTNSTSDLNELGHMAIAAQEELEAERLSAVTDRGYYNGKEVLKCDTVGITAYVSKPLTSANTAQGLYGKERFRFDGQRNVYVCPAGSELTYRFSTQEKGRPIHYFRATLSTCRSCKLRSLCTRNKQARTITRAAFEEVQERMAERVAANPEIMRRRKAIIEHVFGTIKRTLGYTYFLCRGFKAVATEVNLTAFAYNLKRVINIVGMQRLMAAVG